MLFTSALTLPTLLVAFATLAASTSTHAPQPHRRHHRRLATRATLGANSSSAGCSVARPAASAVALPAGWTSKGCVQDADSRLLPQAMYSGVWTATTCIAKCATAGFTFAGVEWTTQCYCGSSLSTIGGAGADLPDSSCGSKCSDGSGCGGFYALSLYATTKAKETSTYVQTAAAVTWPKQGCVTDDVASRSLAAFSSINGTGWTVNSCISLCSSKGYSIAGLEVGTECYCDNAIAPAAVKVDDGECSWYCSNTDQKCGGTFRMSIYSTYTLANIFNGITVPASSSSVRASSSSTAPRAPSSTLVSVAPAKTSSSSVKLVASSSVPVPSSKTSASSVPSKSPSSSAVVAAPTTTSKSSATPVVTNIVLPTTYPADTTSTTVAAPSVPTLAIPASSGVKAVYAHFMVGNTYPYTYATWLKEINIAAASGIDGFALNLGSDYWQPAQVALAYQAAKHSGTGFKLFISFDMTVMSCGSILDGAAIRAYIATYAAHPNQAWYQGELLASTFAGSDCSFGVGNWDDGWNLAVFLPLKALGLNVFFMPSVFSNPSTFSSVKVMDGELNWNSGWPMSNTNLDFSSDQHYIDSLGSKKYMAAVSPGFFTHYGVNTWNKNWLFRSDDWLFSYRWESLIANRNKFDLIEILTWNDYGESSYVGPIEGAQPNSQAWVDGYDHTPLLAVNQYYATAFKTGSYPAITTDTIYLMARTHPRFAVATSDSVPTPTHNDWTDDNFYALIFASASSQVTLTSGAGSQTFSVPAGITRLEYPLATGSGMSATMIRSGSTVATLAPSDFLFVANPPTYNFNYKIYGSS